MRGGEEAEGICCLTHLSMGNMRIGEYVFFLIEYWGILPPPQPRTPRDVGEEAQSTRTFSTFMLIIARRAVGDLQWLASVLEIRAYVSILAHLNFLHTVSKIPL